MERLQPGVYKATTQTAEWWSQLEVTITLKLQGSTFHCGNTQLQILNRSVLFYCASNKNFGFYNFHH